MSVLTNIIPKAEQLATNSLKGGKWDTEAFLVLSLVELLKQQVASVDLVPESTIDEHIDSIKDYFVEYMRNKNVYNLNLMLTQTEQVLSELYQSLDGTVEIDLFNNFLKDLQKFKL